MSRWSLQTTTSRERRFWTNWLKFILSSTRVLLKVTKICFYLTAVPGLSSLYCNTKRTTVLKGHLANGHRILLVLVSYLNQKYLGPTLFHIHFTTFLGMNLSGLYKVSVLNKTFLNQPFLKEAANVTFGMWHWICKSWETRTMLSSKLWDRNSTQTLHLSWVGTRSLLIMSTTRGSNNTRALLAAKYSNTYIISLTMYNFSPSSSQPSRALLCLSRQLKD